VTPLYPPIKLTFERYKFIFCIKGLQFFFIRSFIRPLNLCNPGMKYALFMFLNFFLFGCMDSPPKTTCANMGAEFEYTTDSTRTMALPCDWENNSTVINLKPVFSDSTKAGIFSVEPAGLVFVSDRTGEIDVRASEPGKYFITNTLSDTCNNRTATASITLEPPLVISEFQFMMLGELASYYSLTDLALRDTSRYKITWNYVYNDGRIREITDISIASDSWGSQHYVFFIKPDPATGKTRDDEALCVDVVNLVTGCLNRRCLGKPLSELPEPGRSL